jgi:dienelactone hydrolase
MRHQLAALSLALYCGPAGNSDSVLPSPTGPSPVGTTIAYLVDATRKDSDFPEGRPITVQLWYPIDATRAQTPTAPYFIEGALVKTLVTQGYYEVEAAVLADWSKLATHSRLDASPLDGTHPLVSFSVGLGLLRANYTSFAEELASHGYVFALVESPFAGVMMRPDGTLVHDTTGRLEAAEGHRAAIDSWVGDVRFVFDRLAVREPNSTVSAVGATIDWKRVAAIGHSSGGLVALQLGTSDERVRAGIDLDGGLVTPENEPLARFVLEGPSRPSLILRSKPLYGDADFARRGITREEWEKRGAAGKASFESLAAASKVPLVIATVAGTGHLSFSDAPFVMPKTITRFGGKVIEERRGWLVITSAIRAFLDDVFAAQASAAFAGALKSTPELEVQARSPSAK